MRLLTLCEMQVLCFYAYFKEAVHESNLENHRIRKCEILYYLEDDSMQVCGSGWSIG